VGRLADGFLDASAEAVIVVLGYGIIVFIQDPHKPVPSIIDVLVPRGLRVGRGGLDEAAGGIVGGAGSPGSPLSKLVR
jgi:hypothetical protein